MIFICHSFLIGQVNSVYLELIVAQVIVEYHNLVSLNGHQDEAGGHVAVQGRVGTGGTTRVYKVLSIILLHAEFVSVPMDQHVTVKFALDCCQSLKVTPWSNLVPMNHPNFDISNLNHLCFWEL